MFTSILLLTENQFCNTDYRKLLRLDLNRFMHWHFSLMICSVSILRVWNMRLASCWEALSFPDDTNTLPSLSLSLLLSATHIQMQTITFYFLSQIRILNHISISLPSFISNIYSHPHTNLSHSVSRFLPSSFLHPSNSPGDNAGEILMCSMKCCCLECCPDHELCFWTKDEAKQPFRGSGRVPHSWMYQQGQLHAGPWSLRWHFAWCKQSGTAMLSPAGATESFCNKSSCSKLKRSLAWSCGGRTTGDTQLFLESFSLSQPLQTLQNTQTHSSPTSLVFAPSCF